MHFQYYPLDSPVHRLDPRVKIIAVLMVSILLFKAGLPGLAAATGIFIAISLVSRVPLLAVFKSLRPVLPFFVCLFILYLLITPGSPVPFLPPGPVKVTGEGLRLGSIQVGKFLLLVMAASIFTMTTSPIEITAGLERLLRPTRILGLSSYDLAMMIALAFRFIPELVGELNSIRQAQQARGADFNEGGIRGKIRSMQGLASALAVNMFRRCDELIDAMEARGYQPGVRTYLHQLSFSWADYGALAALTVLAVAAWM
ncbi:MAG: energy-coupling factor transporter transmembrane component T [Syntrophomonadaceae bacterium]